MYTFHSWVPLNLWSLDSDQDQRTRKSPSWSCHTTSPGGFMMVLGGPRWSRLVQGGSCRSLLVASWCRWSEKVMDGSLSIIVRCGPQWSKRSWVVQDSPWSIDVLRWSPDGLNWSTRRPRCSQVNPDTGQFGMV